MSRAGARIKFSAQPGDRLLLLTPLVSMAGKQRLPHPGQHLVVKAQPAQQFGELALQHLLPHILAATGCRQVVQNC